MGFLWFRDFIRAEHKTQFKAYDANAFDMHFKLGADIKHTFYHNTHANA